MKTELAVLLLFAAGWIASATGTCAYNDTPPLGGVMYVSCQSFSVSEPCYLYIHETGGPGVAVYPEGAALNATGNRIVSDAAGHLAFGLPVPQSPYHVGASYTADWFCANDAPDALVFVPGIPGQPAQVTDWMAWLKNEGNLGFVGLIACAGVVGLILVGLGLGILAKAKNA